jgi:hypothetical protein
MKNSIGYFIYFKSNSKTIQDYAFGIQNAISFGKRGLIINCPKPASDK